MPIGFCAKHQDFYKGINYKKSSRNPQRIFQVKKKSVMNFLALRIRIGLAFVLMTPNLTYALCFSERWIFFLHLKNETHIRKIKE
jgi:hypothetical protein